jgi:hypothetical protein
MAEGLIPTPIPAQQADEPAPRRRPHWKRFVAVFVALGVVLGAAAIGIVFSALNDRPGPWSSWRPTSSDALQKAHEIADHVEGRYQDAPGQRLATVSSGQTLNPSLPAATVVRAQGDNGVFDLALDNSLYYTLCGTGIGCSIPGPDVKNGRLPVLGREALELALYSFKYIHEVDSVFVILPPGFGDNQQSYSTYFFRRGDLKGPLSRPLSRTLPGGPPLPSSLPGPQRAQIAALTAGTRFRLVVTPSEDRNFTVLLLTPMTP